MALCFGTMLQQIQIYITWTAVCVIGGECQTVQVFVGSDDGFPSEQLLLLTRLKAHSAHCVKAPTFILFAILLQRSPLIS